jgi:hypothetical protein
MSRSGPFANDEWIVRCQLWRICLHSRASWKVKPEWHFVFNNSQKCGGKKYDLQLMIPPCMMTPNTRNWKEQGQQADLNFAGGEAWRSTGCLEPKAATRRIEWSFWELTKEIWIEMDGGGGFPWCRVNENQLFEILLDSFSFKVGRWLNSTQFIRIIRAVLVATLG